METIAERQYLLESGETVSVSVEATNTVHAVNYNLNKQNKGSLGPGETVAVPKPGSGFSSLVLLFTFSGTGGKYTVTITGETGDPDTDVIDQGSFDIPSTSAEYLFQ